MTDDTHPSPPDGLQKLCELVEDLAKLEGIQLTSVLVDEGRPIVASDYHLLSITAGEHSVSEKLHHEELTAQNQWTGKGLTEAKIRSAVERLRLLLDR